MLNGLGVGGVVRLPKKILIFFRGFFRGDASVLVAFSYAVEQTLSL